MLNADKSRIVRYEKYIVTSVSDTGNVLLTDRVITREVKK
jgi:hypothetical protein